MDTLVRQILNSALKAFFEPLGHGAVELSVADGVIFRNLIVKPEGINTQLQANDVDLRVESGRVGVLRVHYTALPGTVTVNMSDVELRFRPNAFKTVGKALVKQLMSFFTPTAVPTADATDAAAPPTTLLAPPGSYVPLAEPIGVTTPSYSYPAVYRTAVPYTLASAPPEPISSGLAPDRLTSYDVQMQGTFSTGDTRRPKRLTRISHPRYPGNQRRLPRKEIASVSSQTRSAHSVSVARGMSQLSPDASLSGGTYASSCEGSTVACKQPYCRRCGKAVRLFSDESCGRYSRQQQQQQQQQQQYRQEAEYFGKLYMPTYR